MLNRFLFCNILFLGSITSLQAQYYTTGQDPASVKWSQIRTDSFRIVFPENFVYNSEYLANILKLTARYETKSLKATVPRMPFLLHTSSTISNGLTVWAPRRIELYTCPPQDIYAEEWLEQLALHEYRHAVQTSKMKQGFSKALYYIFGEQATGAVLGMYIPTWFLEGDATVTETALSNSGRGRVASFTAPLRAQFLQKGIYSYDLATMGSYKTFTPDAYTLGYHLVAKGRERYGYELWDHVLDKVARLPFMVVPFNAGIRQKSGYWKTGLYRKMMEELLIEWQKEEDESWRSFFNPVTIPNPADHTTWDRPQFVNDSILIAARWSNEGVPKLMILNRKGETKPLKKLGAYQPGSLSVSEDAIVWTEYRPDIRWENRSYSVIRKLEIRKLGNWSGGQETRRLGGKEVMRSGWSAQGAGHRAQVSGIRYPISGIRHPASGIRHPYLTRKSRYFSPALSQNGSYIAAVQIKEENQSFIDILKSGDGELLLSIAAPDNGLFLQPAWSPDGRKIAFILLTQDGKSLHTMDSYGGSFTSLLPPSFQEISGPPLFFRNYLLFMADYTGIENIFAIDTLTRQLYQVTSARFQATNPSVSPDGSGIVYSDYTANGMMVVTRTSDPSQWIPLDSIPEYRFELAEAMAEQEGVNIQDSIRKNYELGITNYDSSLTTSPYRKGSHLFDIHSWAPVSIDADNLTLKPGVSILSQNLLSTMFAGAGYEYDLSERTGRLYLNLSYKGWFPVIDVNYSYGKRAGIGRYSNTGESFRYTWNESNLQATISVPLNLSRGIWYRKFQPSLGTSWIYVIHDKNTPEQFTEGSINTLDYRLYMYNYIRSNYQDMFPKWGQNLDINFRHTPFTGNDMGSVFGISTNLYFPGIFRHHGIRIYGGYQRRWDNLVYGYQFSSLILLPRGTETIYPEEMVSLSANYKFPFLRLDASVGSLLYIKRFKLNLFYDWAQGTGVHGDQTPQSTGFELTSEMHVLRFVAPFELGVQGVYLPESGTWAWRFLWGVSF
ncbi:MAG: PD40 domain-containing protein [Bacteroidales bacterium]|nr:PD40 domain-containing protein [Bacteroidales bacterium]